MDSGPKLQKPQIHNEEEKDSAIDDSEFIEQAIEFGFGKIITSGKTVHGFDTNFPKQIEIGDHLILMQEESQVDKTSGITVKRLVEKERRRVNMVLSARSCGIEEAFTEDIMEKSEYWV